MYDANKIDLSPDCYDSLLPTG